MLGCVVSLRQENELKRSLNNLFIVTEDTICVLFKDRNKKRKPLPLPSVYIMIKSLFFSNTQCVDITYSK